ncbi:MAG: MEKHLA domain-containing protein [Burkholderiales bacterium]
MEPAPGNLFFAEHATLLLDSYRKLTGRHLVPDGAPAERARALYEASFVVVSHDTAADPVFNYANLAAQRLFEMDWDSFVALPSRLSAGPAERAERQRLLDVVMRNGYIDDYCGMRITRSGRRFRVEAATVWNLTHADGKHAGQAAAFSVWRFV